MDETLVDHLIQRGLCLVEIAETAEGAMDAGIAIVIRPTRQRSQDWPADTQKIIGFEWVSSIPRLILAVPGEFRNRGIGKALLRKTFDRMRAWSFNRVEVEAPEAFEPFFERQGFTIVSGLVRQIEGATLRTFEARLI